MNAFRGFDPDAFVFLAELANDNTATFFDTQRPRYQRVVAGPMKEFVSATAEVLADTVHPGLHGDPKVGRSMFRINRDTRFSADKTPYKTNLAALFWLGTPHDRPRERPCAYVSLDATSVQLGAGWVGLKGEPLERFRDAVVSPAHGPEVRAAVDALVAAGSTLSEPSRKRIPRGYPADHTNADLLVRDGFHATHLLPRPDVATSSDFPEWAAGELTRYGPLLDWFEVAAG